MPIAFPAFPRGRKDIQAKALTTKPPGYVQAPNLGNPNYRFSAATLGPGMGSVGASANARNPGVNFGKTFAIDNIETRPQALTDAALWKEDDGTLTTALTGVSRDSAGAALGSCRVMAFRTSDNSFAGETTSDGSGNWSLANLTGGAFYLVEYKAGAPDRAGTSVNTLLPVAV